MTILFYAPTSLGLGHISRSLAIAEAIKVQAPDLPIIIACEAPDGRLLEGYPYPYYVLPAADAITYADRWQAQAEQAVAWQVHYGLFRAIMAAHRPSLVVFDTFVERELHQIVLEFGAKEALTLRYRPDIIDMLSLGHDIFKHFSVIIFPYDQYEIDEPDLEWVLDPNKILYAGPCVRPLPDIDLLTLTKTRYGIQADRFTVVIGNGGGVSSMLLPSDYDYYLETVLEGIQMADAELPPYHAIVIKGPLHSRTLPTVNLNKGRIQIRDFEPYMLSLYAASNMAITRGGYNTRSELVAVGVPSLCIPMTRSQDDQESGLKILARNQPNLSIGSLDAARIAEALVQQASQPRWHYAGGAGQSPSRLRDFLAPKLIELAG